MRLSRDGIAGLVVLAGSVWLFVLTLGLKASALVPIGPGFYPRIVLGITAFFSLLLVVNDWLEQRRVPPASGAAQPTGAASGAQADPARALAARPNYTLVLLNFVLFGAYVAALPGLGFRIATLLYVAIANAILAPPKGLRGVARVLAIAAATAFLAHFVFENHLSVLLPRGRWTGF